MARSKHCSCFAAQRAAEKCLVHLLWGQCNSSDKHWMLCLWVQASADVMMLLQKSLRLLEKKCSSFILQAFMAICKSQAFHGSLLFVLQPHFQAFMAICKSQAFHGSLVVHPQALITFFSSSKPLMASQMLPPQASLFMAWLHLWLCKLASAKSLCKLCLLLRLLVS